MVEKKHIVTAFDEDLTTLNDIMARMGALAETQLFASTEALIARNPSDLDDIIKRGYCMLVFTNPTCVVSLAFKVFWQKVCIDCVLGPSNLLGLL